MWVHQAGAEFKAGRPPWASWGEERKSGERENVEHAFCEGVAVAALALGSEGPELPAVPQAPGASTSPPGKCKRHETGLCDVLVTEPQP